MRKIKKISLGFSMRQKERKNNKMTRVHVHSNSTAPKDIKAMERLSKKEHGVVVGIVQHGSSKDIVGAVPGVDNSTGHPLGFEIKRKKRSRPGRPRKHHRGIGGYHLRQPHRRRTHMVKSHRRGSKTRHHRQRRGHSVAFHVVHHHKKRRPSAAFALWRKVLKEHGYLKRSSTTGRIKLAPKRGTKEHAMLKREYEIRRGHHRVMIRHRHRKMGR